MMIRTVALKIQRLLASRWFFIGLIVFFAIQAVWIALSAKYPMAFDEDFHLGIIKIYAAQWSPFLNGTPDHSAAFGAVTRDPSYLFHYVMSFPYRLSMTLFHNETTTIIILRLIDVALAVWSIVLFRRVLLRARIGRASAHTILGIFVQLPIFALMAGQINYDNALLVVVAVLCLLTQKILTELRTKHLSAPTVIWFVVVCLIGSLVKYAFLPLAAAAVIIIFVSLWRQHRFKKYTREFWVSWRQSRRLLQVGLLAAVIVSAGLFSQRYLVNVAEFHSITPACDSVLDVDTCQSYGPWARDYHLKQAKKVHDITQPDSLGKTLASPFVYTAMWLYGMWYRLFFMINGNLPVLRYQNYPSLPLIGGVAVIIALAGFVALATRWKKVVAGRTEWFFVSMIGLYCGALLFQNYSSYLHTGQAVAVNGRYLLPILVLLGALMITALSHMLRRTEWRAGLAVLSLLLFLSGNSLVSFIVRSNDHWYWQNQTVLTVNHTAQKVLKPLVWHEPTHHPLPQP